ncbi:copper chaperone PCu(A)C [Kineosporia babensis]|uniref:Copper chaperone PCu(A)C n=1 Tax=Kineosporia babensis TaxID=499548 RepID=A0A9X1SRD6_9ACTN|nr:copper chaperone PCu(A)C [Kineosporia babensis]MCD5309504.1 copper chaperone PCu(A)C [Kineosporia babensis]
MPANLKRSRRFAFAASALVAVAALSACSSDSATDSDAAADNVKVVGGDASATAADRLNIADQWVKTADAKAGMTAIFGTITNTGDQDVVVESAKTSASDTTELHEMVMKGNEMIMQEKEGGFTVPAGGEHELAPGGDHLMVLNMTEPIEAGDEVTVRLTLGDGSTQEFTALAKETTAGEEKYDTEMDMGDSDEMGEMEDAAK